MVQTGLEKVVKNIPTELKGKRVGLVVHAASVDSQYRHAIDLFRESSIKLSAVFGPQHGLFGQTQDNMIEWDGDEDTAAKSEIPTYSLYGKQRRPTSDMLDGLDALVLDMQDVGARPYTYIWTIKECMAAAVECGLPVWVLDRPNPVSYLGIDGAVLSPDFFTFVGGAEIPLAHGMTMGEMAIWLQKAYFPSVDLHVVTMDGWERSMTFAETQLPWVIPSPNMPTERTAAVYPGMVIFETVSTSEGRGTTTPFEMFGMPGIDVVLFEKSVVELGLSHVNLRRHDFIPTFNKFHGDYCTGFQIHPLSKEFKPVETAAILLKALAVSAKDGFCFTEPPYEYEFEKKPIDIVSGDSSLREWIHSNGSVAVLRSIWHGKYGAFREHFEECRLYKGSL